MASVRRLCFSALALVAGTAAFAQTATTGAVSGTVLDGSGQPVAGATVTLASSQITRTVTTDASGHFLAGLLNPGSWRVTVQHAGAASATQTVSVSTNTTSPMVLHLAEEGTATVTVMGTAAAIDPTTTSQGINLPSEVFSKLPTSRNLNDLAYLAPSTHFGGTMSEGEGLDYSMSGASGAENQFIIDGLVTNDPRYGGQGTELVPDFIDTVEVQTGGFKPEFSALGGVFNATIKSGTNDLRASAWVTWAPADLVAKPKSNEAGFRQATPADRYDVGFSVGGPLLKDKLFYFVGADGDFQTGKTPEANNSGFTGDKDKVTRGQYILKLNWYLAENQQLTGTYFGTDRKDTQANAYPSGYGNAQFGRTIKYSTSNVSLVWDWSITPTVLLSVKAGASHLDDNTLPTDTTNLSIDDQYWFSAGGPSPNPALDGFDYYRGGYGSYAHEKGDTSQLKADLTWIAGDHTLKFGASYLSSSYFREDFASGPAGQNLTWGIYEDPSSSTGVTAYSTLYGNIGGAKVKAIYQGYYAQDTWELATGFRLFYGARAETQEQKDLYGRTFLKFTDLGKYIQPRLGFTWDLHKDGRSKLNGSYAWYYEQIPQRIGIREFGNQQFLLQYYDVTYSPTGLGTLGANTGTVDYGTPFNFVPVAHGIKLPKRTEVTLGFEQAIGQNLVFSVNGIYRDLKDPIEDSTIIDPAGNPYNYADYANGIAQAILWNPGSSVSWTARPGSTDAAGNDISGQTVTVNNSLYPEAKNRYVALTVGLKRQTATTFWSLNYTWSHLYGNYEGVIAPDLGGGGQPDGNITASWDYWPYVGTGDLNQDRRHSFKAYGSHKFMLGSLAWTVGGSWTWQSGLPVSLFDDGSSTLGLAPGTLGSPNPLDPGQYDNSTPDHFQLGNHGRTASTSQVDFHTDLEWKLGKGKLIPSVDVFNLFNARTVTSVWQYATHSYTDLPDARYGQPQEWLEGRRIQFGVKYQF
ncbi:MAG TPA: carboxypeptidase regulatory-like domain-containing protein [Holophagaceae bacterium]|nr:carboxypeptidase regulatory-like domain-containing protein [Holophagaceae bacterium]